jgi:RNA polymerase sigma-70 factor (ECF subfamily)
MTALQSRASFEGWVFTIARNVLRTAGARGGHDPLQRADAIDGDGPGELAADAADPEARLLGDERLRVCESALRALPDRQRQCLLLRALQDLSYEEIAQVLGLSAHTVRNHLAQARATLRRALREQGLDDEEHRHAAERHEGAEL